MDAVSALEVACDRFESGADTVFKAFEIYMDLVGGILEEFLDAGGDAEAISTLSEPRRTVFVVDVLMTEVNNGGFEQYYGNPMGFTAVLAPDCYRRIGMPQLARVIENANGIFPGGPSVDEGERDEQIDTLGGRLSELLSPIEDEYFELNSDINCKNVRYMLQHQSDFFD
ncbi:MAG: DUF4375 domain-containing protein [Phycisphaerales bacterium JB058]